MLIRTVCARTRTKPSRTRTRTRLARTRTKPTRTRTRTRLARTRTKPTGTRTIIPTRHRRYVDNAEGNVMTRLDRTRTRI